MVECERRPLDVIGRMPRRIGRVGTCRGHRPIRDDRQVRNADDAATRVPSRCSVGGELLQVASDVGKARLLVQLSSRCTGQIFVGEHEAARERPLPFERRTASLYQENVKLLVADR